MSYYSIDPNEDIEPYIEIRPEDSYPKSVLDEIKMISIKRSESVPFGSMVYRIQKYPGDIDVYETYLGYTNINDIVKKFAKSLQTVVKRIVKGRLHYYSEIKAGLDKRYDVDIGTVENGNYEPSYELANIVHKYYKKKLLNKGEHDIIMFILNKALNTANDYDVIYNIFREHKILRWSADEVLKGKKVLPGGETIKLTDAIKQKSYVKIDMIAVVNGRFVEVTNFFILGYVKGEGEDLDVFPINLDYDFLDNSQRKIIQDKQLKEDIEKLYFSDIFYSPFKMFKRMYALARARNDTEILAKIVPFVSSDASLLYQIKSEIDSILLVMEKFKRPPIATINNSIDNFKPRIASVIEIDQVTLETLIEYLIKAIKTTSIKSKAKYLKLIKALISLIINELTINYMNSVGINPPPNNYLPSHKKYDSFVRYPDDKPINPIELIVKQVDEYGIEPEEDYDDFEVDFINEPVKKQLRFAELEGEDLKRQKYEYSDKEMKILLLLRSKLKVLFDLFGGPENDESVNEALFRIYRENKSVKKDIDKELKGKTVGDLLSDQDLRMLKGLGWVQSLPQGSWRVDRGQWGGELVEDGAHTEEELDNEKYIRPRLQTQDQRLPEHIQALLAEEYEKEYSFVMPKKYLHVLPSETEYFNIISENLRRKNREEARIPFDYAPYQPDQILQNEYDQLQREIRIGREIENEREFIRQNIHPNKQFEYDVIEETIPKGGGPFQTAANFYRKRFCKGKARPLLDGEYHLGCHNFTGQRGPKLRKQRRS